MKANIHPQWYSEAKVICACGNTFTVGSTKPEIQVEICAACHPYFTGTMKYIDTAGRVERFQAKQQAGSNQKWVAKKQRKLLRKLEQAKEEEARPKSFKELLQK